MKKNKHYKEQSSLNKPGWESKSNWLRQREQERERDIKISQKKRSDKAKNPSLHASSTLAW